MMLTEEIKGAIDTTKSYGGNAKAKANATQEIPLLLSYATNRRWKENLKVKHNVDDKLYLYDMVNTKKEKETKYPA